MARDDDTVYCDIQMPIAQGRELLQLLNASPDSGDHPNLDTVFEHMQLELTMAIDVVANPRPLAAARPTKR